MDHIFNSRIARMSRRRAFVVYQINAIGRRGPTAFLSQQGQPSFLPSFLQKTFSRIQTINRAVLQFLRCFDGSTIVDSSPDLMEKKNKIPVTRMDAIITAPVAKLLCRRWSWLLNMAGRQEGWTMAKTLVRVRFEEEKNQNSWNCNWCFFITWKGSVALKHKYMRSFGSFIFSWYSSTTPVTSISLGEHVGPE